MLLLQLESRSDAEIWKVGELMQTFKRCDLHVHSSSCESRSYPYKEFEKTLMNSDLDIIAITDHNSVDVDLIRALSEKLATKDKALLAGVELNVKIDEETQTRHNLVVSPDTEYFHGIVWCDAADVELLRDAVFRLLDGIGITDHERQDKTPKEISALSKGKAFFLKDVQREMEDLKHFFTFHESKGDNRRNLSGYLKNGQGGNDKFKQSLFYYNQHLAIEGGKKSKPISDFFELDLNTMVCRFFCSDAKTLAKIGSAFTWIDFDGDIDSLNLAITDPQSRIATSDECQCNPQTNLETYLESIKFNLLNTSTECEIQFAPSYNGIVGSRGSGKSLLARILSGQVNEGYEKHVDPESIRYRIKGAQYSKNLPRCLYVRQGELGDVFDSSDYRSVPFLEERLKEMKESAKTVSDKHYAEAVDQLNHQKELVNAFIEKHKGNVKRPDALQAEKPSGVSIKESPSIASDQKKLAQLLERVGKLIEQLGILAKSTANLPIKDVLPETIGLSAALNERIENATLHLQSSLADLNTISNAIKMLESEPFSTRDYLLECFSNEITITNRTRALGVHNYIQNIKEANEFLDDLLEMRIELWKSDELIKGSIDSMLQPIPTNTYQADEDEVTIGLTISETNSYEDSLKSQLKNSIDSETAVANLVLQCSNLEKAKQDLLNGNKFRGLTNATAVVEKLYANIESDLSKNKDFEIDVSFNGVSMKEMSPGMQAQALLKLLLNDKLSSEGYAYVIFDQPEDNLDTPTISDVLVNRLKRLKKEVQIFVVSHSAPVIINGDARNVVMSKSDGSSIEYSPGVINKYPAKGFISEVLDGGERFLKMRLYKYDFQVGDKND